MTAGRPKARSKISPLLADFRLFLLGQGFVLIRHYRYHRRGGISLVAMVFTFTGGKKNAAPNLHHGMLLCMHRGGIAGKFKFHANGHAKSSTFPAGAIWRRPAPGLIKTKDRGLLMLLQPPSLVLVPPSRWNRRVRRSTRMS